MAWSWIWILQRSAKAPKSINEHLSVRSTSFPTGHFKTIPSHYQSALTASDNIYKWSKVLNLPRTSYITTGQFEAGLMKALATCQAFMILSSTNRHVMSILLKAEFSQKATAIHLKHAFKKHGATVVLKMRCFQ